MSEWQVDLEFAEGNSSKFWRARVEGGTLYVNFGKIGTNGQTQVKELGPELAQKEIEKLEREKRKKGYQDAGGGGGDDEEDDAEEEEEDEEDEAPAPPAKKPKAAGGQAKKLTLDAKGRKVETTLTLAGTSVRMDATETYATPEAARAAFYRLLAQLAGEGYEE